jgi:hypothetical protein
VTTNTSCKRLLSIVGHPTVAVKGWWVKNSWYTAPFLPSSVRHRVPPAYLLQHRGFTHIYTKSFLFSWQNELMWTDTCHNGKNWPRHSTAKTAHFSRMYSENTVLVVQSCKCTSCTYSKWQKYKSFFYRTLWRTRRVCSASSILRLLHEGGSAELYNTPSSISGVFTVPCLSNCTSKKVYVTFFPKLPIKATIFFHEFGD